MDCEPCPPLDNFQIPSLRESVMTSLNIASLPNFKKVNGTSRIKKATSPSKTNQARTKTTTVGGNQKKPGKNKISRRQPSKDKEPSWQFTINDSDCYSLGENNTNTDIQNIMNTEQLEEDDMSLPPSALLHSFNIITESHSRPPSSTPTHITNDSTIVDLVQDSNTPVTTRTLNTSSDATATNAKTYSFDIPTGVPPDIDEIKWLIDVCQKTGCARPSAANPSPSIWDTINEMLINFVYSLAGATVTRDQHVTNAFDYRVMLATEADRIVENLIYKKRV